MRDFTYIDDVVEGVVRLIGQVPSGDVPCEIFNIGRGEPTSIVNFIAELERVLGRKARFEMLPMQAGDVPCTYADTSKLKSKVGFAPQTPLRKGVESFVRWYRSERNPLK